MWIEACRKEKEYTHFRGNWRRQQFLRGEFIRAQNAFDQKYRQFERLYYTKIQIELQVMHTDDYKEFWKRANKLGLRKPNESFIDFDNI